MKPNSFLSSLKLMITAEAIAPFFFGSVALSVLGNAVYQILTNWIGSGNSALIGISFGCVLVIVFVAWILSRFLRRLGVVGCSPSVRHPAPRKGLIALVSREEPVQKAANWHKGSLKHCWLFHSDQTAGISGKLREELLGCNVNTRLVHVGDIYDPIEIKRKVEQVYAQLPEGCDQSDVILDFTGMTACASVGSVLACLRDRRPIQYTPAQFDKKLDALRSLDPMEIILSGD